MHSVARPAAATPQTPGEASAATTPFPTSRELRKVFSVKQQSPVFLTSARCIPKCDVSGCHSCGRGELASGPRGWALPGTRARGACAGRGRLSFFFFSLPFKTEKVMQFEKVQTIRHCRELKFETTPRGAELSRAPPLPCSLPGRAALGPPEPRDRRGWRAALFPRWPFACRPEQWVKWPQARRPLARCPFQGPLGSGRGRHWQNPAPRCLPPAPPGR